MSIDFFKKGCQNSSSLSRFGLCDDESEPLKPAYIDEVNVSNWLAQVNNVKCYPVDFYAIDWRGGNKRKAGKNERRKGNEEKETDKKRK